MAYTGPERRVGLSEADMEAIAERAAEKALAKVYSQVGRGVLNKAAWLIGALIVAALVWVGKNNLTLK